MPDMKRWAGAVIRHSKVNADYLLLRVGAEGECGTGMHYWQGFAVEQMTHRIWAMPMTTTEVIREFNSGRISYAD